MLESDTDVLELTPGAGALNALARQQRTVSEVQSFSKAISKTRAPGDHRQFGMGLFQLGKSSAKCYSKKHNNTQTLKLRSSDRLLWSVGREIEARDLMTAQLKTSPNNTLLIDTAVRLAIPLPK